MKIEELKNKIISASQAYHSGNPIISDNEFDAMIEQLKILSPKDKLLNTISSGYSPEKDTTGEKIKHKYLTVGSLSKINAETCEKYFASKSAQYCITSKIDGGSIVAYYDYKGKLDRAITRGDGNIGIDCTSKLKFLIPNSIPLSNVAIRGEIIMDIISFNKYYPDAASPRNTALGIINKDNPTETEIKLLSFVTYNIYGNNDYIPTKKSDVMDWLHNNKFITAKYTKLFSSNPEFLESMRGKLNPEYSADGLVITNEENRFDEIAYKFVSETAETTVTGIIWETSRLGNIIPVVHFNPVKLSGATLSKCSGFNAKWIFDNLITAGAKIVVHRAGEVIPYVKEVLPIMLWANPNIEMQPLPTHCPICQKELQWKGVHLLCPNEKCPSKLKFNLFHWCNIIARIDSLGESILVPFLNTMGWENILDIYNTNDEEWTFIIDCMKPTEHVKKVLIELYHKLYDEPINPDIFLAAFGFSAVGTTISKMISKEMGLEQFFYTPLFPSNFSAWKFNRTIPKPAIESLNENYNTIHEIYHQIKKHQGFIKKDLKEDTMKVVITGKLSKGRKELAEEFASHGINVIGSISKEVAYLITDNPNSGSVKNQAAQKLGIRVISETNFRREIGL